MTTHALLWNVTIHHMHTCSVLGVIHRMSQVGVKKLCSSLKMLKNSFFLIGRTKLARSI
jgi:hypothetical protein